MQQIISPHTLRMMRAVRAAMSAPTTVVAMHTMKIPPRIICEAGNAVISRSPAAECWGLKAARGSLAPALGPRTLDFGLRTLDFPSGVRLPGAHFPSVGRGP